MSCAAEGAYAYRCPTVPTLTWPGLDPAQLATRANPIAMLTLLHRDAQETHGRSQERLRRRAARYRVILRQGYRAHDIRRLLQLMEHLLRLPPPLVVVARDQLRRVEQEETGMDTFVTSFEEIGRMEERRDIVLRLLRRKVGALPDDVQARIAALSPEQLLTLSEVLLDFTTPEDLATWFDGQHT
jgi:hypothetical protein